MNKEYFKNSIREVPDFPKKGILFYDLTTAFKDPVCLKFISNSLVDLYKNKGITKVIGIEARGFIMGASLAEKIDAGFVPIRKNGKLPAKAVEISYAKEYGKDTIEIHEDALNSEDIVLIHDDLLATGGTMKAAIDLVKMFHVKQIYVNFLVELDFLKGRSAFEDENLEIKSLLKL
jgi:adenine phosphoribosyltransferase